MYLAQFFVLNGNCQSSVFEGNLASVQVLTEGAKHHGLRAACELGIWLFLLAWVTEDLLEFLGMFHHPPNSLGSEANKSNSLDQPGTRHPGEIAAANTGQLSGIFWDLSVYSNPLFVSAFIPLPVEPHIGHLEQV